MLHEKFVALEKVLAASVAQIAALGITRSTTENIVGFRDFDPAEKELCELSRIGAHLVNGVTRNIRRACASSLTLQQTLLYMVTRRSTVSRPPGREPPPMLAAGWRRGMELAAKDFAVVSEFARRIDCEAHRSALAAGATTIAAMGCAIDLIYPAEHRKLAAEIVEKGVALISELPVGTEPLAQKLPHAQ